MSTRLLSCCLLLAGFALAPTASAGVLRCGIYLIHDSERNGPTKYEVLKKCGEPLSRMGHTWIYKKGGRTKSLQFNGNGMLLTIRDA